MELELNVVLLGLTSIIESMLKGNILLRMLAPSTISEIDGYLNWLHEHDYHELAHKFDTILFESDNAISKIVFKVLN